MGSKNDSFDFNDYVEQQNAETGNETPDFGDELEVSDDLGTTDTPDADTQADDVADAGDEAPDEAAAEPDAEPETEAVAPEIEPEPAPKPKPDYMIPKRRLDQETAKRRSAEQQLDALRKELAEARATQTKQATPDEIQQLLRDANARALEGDLEEAAKLQHKAIEAMRPAEQRAEQVSDLDTLVAQVEERVELKHTLKEVFRTTPQLDPESDQFDETMSNEAVEYQDFFMSKGYALPVAVQKAAETVAKVYGLGAAQPAPARKPGRDTAPDVSKKMEMATKQPAEPSTKRAQRPAIAPSARDAERMSFDEYMALPESVRAEMRGDAA